MRRSWLARGAAVVGLCLVWASGLGAATVWPRWNRAEMLRVQERERRSQVAEVEGRLAAAKLAAGTDTLSRARDRVLSRDELPEFLREVRSRAGALGAKVVVLEHAEGAPGPRRLQPVPVRVRLVAEGRFPALFEVLRYLESRRVFVAVNRAEIAPLAADGRLKAVYQFEFLVVPATDGGAEGRV